MAHILRLLERNRAGVDLTVLNLSSTGNPPRYYLLVEGFQPGEPRYKKTRSSSPLSQSQRLTYIIPDATETRLRIGVIGTSAENAISLLNDLDLFAKRAMDAQVARANQAPANDFYLAATPQGGTKLSKSRIIEMEIKRPATFFDHSILSSIIEPLEIIIRHDPSFSASVFEATSSVINNGYGNAVVIEADTSDFIEGDQPAPLRVKIEGGDGDTNMALVSLRYTDDPELFHHALWAKDADLSNHTVVSGTDATLDGDNTSTGTITTPVDTSEHLTHRWIIDDPDEIVAQYGSFQVYGVGKRSADVFTARLRVGLIDANNNIIYDSDEGYSLDSDEEDLASIGPHSGSNLAFFDLGFIGVPTPFMARQAVHGLVYELYLTCSDITGSPTATIDKVILMPLMEAPQNTGFVAAEFPVDSGDTGVEAVWIDAVPDSPDAYTTQTTGGTAAFGGTIITGAPLYAHPRKKAVMHIVLLNNSVTTAPTLNHTLPITATIYYELRYGSLVGVA